MGTKTRRVLMGKAEAATGYLTRYVLGTGLFLFGALLGCLCTILAGRPDVKLVELQRDAARRQQRTVEAENATMRARQERTERNGE